MENLVKKIKNVSLSLDFVPRLITNLNMRKSPVGFTFFLSDRKDSSWVNLVQKLNTVSLSRNLVPSLI